MAHTPRLDPIGGWHHVTNHRTGDGDLFLVDHDRHLMLRILLWALEKHNVVVAGFCLMGNHFHLIVHCPNGGISRFMHDVSSLYGSLFNRRHDRQGTLFSRRFHSTIITSDEQLLMATRYVDRNPLELGFDITKYPWSSFLAHAEASNSYDDDLARGCQVPIRIIGGHAAYRRFVCTDGPSDKFQLSNGGTRLRVAAAPVMQELLQSLCVAVAMATGQSTPSLVERRPGARSDARSIAVLVAYDSGLALSSELCSFFSFAAASSLLSAVKRARRRSERSPEFRALVEQARYSWANDSRQLAS